MQKRIVIKNHIQEIRLINERSIVAFVVMLVLVALLIFRLGYLQLSKHDLYTTLSQKNWLDLVPLEPTRGLIYDRHGILLAENIPVFSLDIIPFKIENLPKMLAEVSKIIPLSETDIAQFQKQLKQHRRFDEIPLKLRLTEAEVAKFYENQYRLPGALIRARLLRHYPLGGSFSHVLGYVGRINIEELNEIDPSNYSASNYIGKQGIEKFYEDELHGSVGYEQAENDASGEPVRILNQIKPEPGKNLYLTLDSRLQMVAEQALAGHRGAVVAIQPKTGQILAMVSEPGFDPNIFIDGISSSDYKTLQVSPDRPLYNRALRGLYPFASTIKPFVALQGLNSGIVSPEYTISDPGWFKLKNSSHIFHDWRHHGHGMVNLNRAITGSCDTYFWDIGLKLGIQRIDNILTSFGFGSVTGVDLDDELAGNVASPAWKRKVKGVGWYEGDTIISVIGQGSMQTTPLQLASGVATIANRGQRFTPYLLLGEQEPGKPYTQSSSTPAPAVVLRDPNIWSTVINAMQNVVTSPEGTGYRLRHAPYSVAAKTGTAQVFHKKITGKERDEESEDHLPEKLRNHSLLIAFAPVEDPEIAIAVIVENSKLASSVARQVLDHYLLPNIKASTADDTRKNIN